MSDEGWKVGQKVVIDRTQIATVDKVTSAGRAKVGTRLFDKSGRETHPTSRWRASLMELLTDEVEAEMELAARARVVFADASAAVLIAERWVLLNRPRGPWNLPDPTSEDVVAKARRLVAAINEALPTGESP